MTLSGRKILITRDSSQADQLRVSLENLGAEIISVPTIAIGEPPDWQPFDVAAANPQQFDWIIFTSTNAVIKTLERLSCSKRNLSYLSGRQIAAVGNQTAKILEKNGLSVTVVPSNFQAEGLLEILLQKKIKGKKIWFPRALEARSLLIEELQKAGASIYVTPVYQNRIPHENKEKLRQALELQKPDWITFTSSSTAHNFITLLDKEFVANCELPKLASIGLVTTKTLESYHLPVTVTAIPQNILGLIQGIVDYETSNS